MTKVCGGGDVLWSLLLRVIARGKSKRVYRGLSGAQLRTIIASCSDGNDDLASGNTSLLTCMRTYSNHRAEHLMIINELQDTWAQPSMYSFRNGAPTDLSRSALLWSCALSFWHLLGNDNFMLSTSIPLTLLSSTPTPKTFKIHPTNPYDVRIHKAYSMPHLVNNLRDSPLCAAIYLLPRMLSGRL